MVLLYRVAVYALFSGTMLYAVWFVGGGLDAATATPVEQAFWIDLALLSLFAVQHSVMARQGFKKRWTRIVPETVERSTYVLCASLALILVFWQWRAIPGAVWSIENGMIRTLLYGLAIAGGITAAVASLLIDHRSLFGLTPVKDGPFRTPGLYKYVRHPIYLGSIVAFWSTPYMTQGHLLFSAVMTTYIFMGVHFEERDLVRQFGLAYEQYQRAVPMIVPKSKSGLT